MQPTPLTRITRDKLFMGMAQLVAMRGTCPRAQVGAVIVRDSRVISMGYNGVPSGLPHCIAEGCFETPCHTCNGMSPDPNCDECRGAGCERSVHAEANAIAFAAKHGIKVLDGSIYTTHEVCNQCARLLVNCGIKQVFYRIPYTRASGQALLESAKVVVTRLG